MNTPSKKSKNNSRLSAKPMLVPRNVGRASITSLNPKDDEESKHEKESTRNSFAPSCQYARGSFKSRKQSYSSLLNENPKKSWTVMNSKNTTPYPENTFIESSHFAKIVDKFQNVFKKEQSETSQGRMSLKASHSRPNLTNENTNFIWKKFEDQIQAPTRNCMNQNIVQHLSERPKPSRHIYGQSLKANKENVWPNPSHYENFVERFVKSPQNIPQNQEIDPDIPSTTPVRWEF